MTTAAQNASAGVYVSNDVGLEVTDGTQSRVQLGLLPVGTNNYGLRVVAANGTTVIIDGTSDVFKIQASGTVTNTAADGTQNDVITTFPGLGTMTAAPASLNWLSSGSDAASYKWIDHAWATSHVWVFTATASGGAVTNAIPERKVDSQCGCGLVNGICQLIVQNWAAAGSGGSTWYTKYYILIEAAM